MSLFKRITLAVSTGVERLVGEIENHDAVVEAGIRDSRRRYAEAAVRHARLRAEGERLAARQRGLERDAADWRRRALAAEDEEQAIECLRRGKEAAAHAESLGPTCARHAALEQRLGEELAGLRRRVSDLEHRRALMRSREATASAAGQVRETEQGARVDLEDAFERWEVRVTEAEIERDADLPQDPFADRFRVAEERADLRAELSALRREHEADGERRHEA